MDHPLAQFNIRGTYLGTISDSPILNMPVPVAGRSVEEVSCSPEPRHD